MTWEEIRFWAAWAIVIIVVFFVALPQARVWALEQYENVAFALNPTAARAVAYGERHFDAQDPAEYDINRAQMFFGKAAQLDPTYPYLYHELARISFLHGNYTLALSQIDLQIQMHGDSEPNSYYVRGLIEGYMGNYSAAAADYSHYIQFDPQDWAAMNDYSWVLLKENNFQQAAEVTARGLQIFPGNPWLLNSNAIALYEIGDLQQAGVQAQAAVQAGKLLTTSQWLTAYPGNDPAIAAEGITTFQDSALQNMHMIALAIASSTVQLK
jgi:tetratricopeptide (TPR) repeat protein